MFYVYLLMLAEILHAPLLLGVVVVFVDLLDLLDFLPPLFTRFSTSRLRRPEDVYGMRYWYTCPLFSVNESIWEPLRVMVTCVLSSTGLITVTNTIIMHSYLLLSRALTWQSYGTSSAVKAALQRQHVLLLCRWPLCWLLSKPFLKTLEK